MKGTIPQGLREYVEGEILPQYRDADPAHGIGHIRQVMENSRELAGSLEVEAKMVYLIAAYHDLGVCRFGRKDHEKTSAQLLREDRNLDRWFTPEEIQGMAQAVEDHRASSDREPRNLYGKIVSEADRDIDPERIVRRCMEYGKSHCPELSPEGQVTRAVEHIREKYGEEGYLKLWLPCPQNQQGLSTLREWLRTGEIWEVCRRFE